MSELSPEVKAAIKAVLQESYNSNKQQVADEKATIAKAQQEEKDAKARLEKKEAALQRTIDVAKSYDITLD